SGNERRFHAVRRTEPDDAPVAGAHLGGDGQPRHHVAAGAAGHDEDGAAGHARPRIAVLASAARFAGLTSLREVSPPARRILASAARFVGLTSLREVSPPARRILASAARFAGLTSLREVSPP